jgi:hypothetical protein
MRVLGARLDVVNALVIGQSWTALEKVSPIFDSEMERNHADSLVRAIQ